MHVPRTIDGMNDVPPADRFEARHRERVGSTVRPQMDSACDFLSRYHPGMEDPSPILPVGSDAAPSASGLGAWRLAPVIVS